MWYCLESGCGDAAWNMALDEALLWHASRTGVPVLRFYGWTESAASFGYFQKYAEVATWTSLRPLVRRPTGGGLVPHDADWTYSMTIPPASMWYELSALESYRRLHEWIRRAFAQVAVPTRLAPEPRKEGPGRCFIGAEKLDLLWQDRKIAGAAQRRNRCGLLIQGSIQSPPPGIHRHQWEQAMRTAAEEDFEVIWTRWELPVHIRQTAEELARTKYSQAAYNQRR
jgi:lipoyl(octanoyl) transferase